MKLNYMAQMIIAVAIIVLCNIVGGILGYRFLRNIGFIVSGLLYAIHPVLPKNQEGNDESKKAVRIAGIFLILVGIFT